MIDHKAQPIHIGFIMDGNRRWSKTKGLLKSVGHAQGANVAKKLVAYAVEKNIKIVSFYNFSKENWSREKSEVDYLMDLFTKFFNSNIDGFHKLGVKLRFLGDKNGLPQKLIEAIEKGTEKTKNNLGTIVQIAMNYSGRDELVRAIKRIVAVNGEITEDNICNNLDSAGVSDPDLIIRTSGEQRLSGFLLWQAVYSEFYFTEVAWPDFTPDELDKAITAFKNRKRRFGM